LFTCRNNQKYNFFNAAKALHERNTMTKRQEQMRRRLLELVAENPGLTGGELKMIGRTSRMHGNFKDAENDGDIMWGENAANPNMTEGYKRSGWFITDQGAWRISIVSN